MKTRAFTVPMLIAVLVAVPAATAKPGKAKEKSQGNAEGKPPANARGESPARGTIIIEGLTLAGTQYGTPSGEPTTVATNPVSIPVRRGDTFTYSTITCATPPTGFVPPWNTFGLQLEPDYPTVNEGPTDRGASVRHEFRGTVTKSKSGGTGKIRGTITTFLCEGGVRTDQIVSRYRAKFRPTSATSVPLVGGGPVPTTGGLAFNGKFKIVGGTGRFEDLKGHGRMMGQFTCLPQSLVRNNAASCMALGGYSEAPFQLRGRFKDPTVPGA